jgi:hypothetical protein
LVVLGVWTQAFTLGGEVLCYLSHASVPVPPTMASCITGTTGMHCHALHTDWDGISTFCPGWSPNWDPPNLCLLNS